MHPSMLPIFLGAYALGAWAQSSSSSSKTSGASTTTLSLLMPLIEGEEYVGEVRGVDDDGTTIVVTCTENHGSNPTAASRCRNSESGTYTFAGTSSYAYSTDMFILSMTSASSSAHCSLVDDDKSVHCTGTGYDSSSDRRESTATETSTEIDDTYGPPTITAVPITAGVEMLSAGSDDSGSEDTSSNDSGSGGTTNLDGTTDLDAGPEETGSTSTEEGAAARPTAGGVASMTEVVKVLVVPGAAMLAAAGWM